MIGLGGNKLNHPKFKWDDEFERFLDSLSDKELQKYYQSLIILKKQIYIQLCGKSG